jgi:hypothetical protein
MMMSTLATATLSAQRVVTSLDLSGTSVWYADSIQSGGGSLSPALRLDWPRATLSAFATVSRLGNGGVSTEGMIGPSVFTPNIGPFVGELAGSAGGSSHKDGTRTGQLLAIGRAHFMTAHAGAYIGADVGRTWDGAFWHDVREGELGAWADHDGTTLLGTMTPVRVADSIRYTDFLAAARFPWAALDLGASVGARAGTVGVAVGGMSRVWGNVSIVGWIRPRLALVATAGAYPVDLTQGYPGGRFVTLALRVASRESHANAPPPSPSPVTTAGEPRPVGVTTFEIKTVNATERMLRIYAPSATSVEVNGDFTAWRAIGLSRDRDGWWTATKEIAIGTHQMNLRIDGGPWLAPPGLLTAADEFGGVVGILVVE